MRGPTGGGRVHLIHGTRHAPRGSDPSATDDWREVGTAGTGWSSGTNYSAGAIVDHGDLRWEAFRPSGPGYGGAIEPGVDSSYVGYWWCQASLFINGANASPTGGIPSPVPLRYRLSIGAPNYLELDGTISVYTPKQIEIEGDLSSASLTYGQTVFIMPPEYQKDRDTPYHAHDDVGGYVPCRLLTTGEFIWNAP